MDSGDWTRFFLMGWGLPFLLYIILQAVTLISVSGRYRVLALLPLPIMIVVAAIAFSSLRAGSNMWPIWIILISPIAVLYLIFVLVFGKRNQRLKDTNSIR
jgi:hypothetical protein